MMEIELNGAPHRLAGEQSLQDLIAEFENGSNHTRDELTPETTEDKTLTTEHTEHTETIHSTKPLTNLFIPPLASHLT